MIKNGLPFTNKSNKLSPKEAAEKNALVFGDATVADLVNKDTDGDGVADWEEPLWDLDPTKKETVPGVPDSTTVNKLKAEEGIEENAAGEPENLTETDKFSRELFSSLAALNQAGAMDQTTVDKIADSLADHLQNPPQRKIFSAADLTITKDSSAVEVKKFNDALNALYAKYPIQGVVLDVLQKFVIDENNADAGALLKLTPIIEQTRARMSAMLKVPVPGSLSDIYVSVLNAGEKVVENLEDIQLYEKDPVIALSGITQYEQSTNTLGDAIGNLMRAINAKLKN